LADANPYQLDITSIIGLNPSVRIWTKNPSHCSLTEKNRATSLTANLHVGLRSAEGKKDGPMTFSGPVPHGEAHNTLETVIMTRIEEDEIFVHAPDIQLLDDDTVSKIIHWKPDIVFAGGPPIYLSRLSEDQTKRAWHNAERLCQAIDRVILDHHLMRSLKWLERLSSKTGKPVMCAADFMHRPRLLLEADRERLFI
jgi:predicted metallo-beta-lactamase superfamily hydrolase